MEKKILTQKIKNKALELGFAKVGITNAEDFDDYIWEDQVDYHPCLDEEKKEIGFTVELVLNVEGEE